MQVDILPIGPIQTNCYVVTCPDTGKAAVIDPGWNDPAILQTVNQRGAEVALILNTHAHWDHIGGNAALARATGAPLIVPSGDMPLLRAKGGADLWQIPLEPSPEPHQQVKGGEMLEVGVVRLEVLFTPGHTLGHVCFYEPAQHVLFDGDVLFRQGIGRADLPGGNMHVLMESIREVLFALPDDTVVYPGHGSPTTIGEERRLNPWLTD